MKHKMGMIKMQNLRLEMQNKVFIIFGITSRSLNFSILDIPTQVLPNERLISPSILPRPLFFVAVSLPLVCSLVMDVMTEASNRSAVAAAAVVAVVGVHL